MLFLLRNIKKKKIYLILETFKIKIIQLKKIKLQYQNHKFEIDLRFSHIQIKWSWNKYWSKSLPYRNNTKIYDDPKSKFKTNYLY
jgi:hypothetical protein